MPSGDQFVNESTLPETMAAMPLISAVVFPLGTTTVQIRLDKNLNLLQEIVADEPILVLFRNDVDEEIAPDNLLETGVIARLVSKLNLPNDVVQVVLQGICRVRYESIVQEEPYFRARVSRAHEQPGNPSETDQLIVKALDTFSKLMNVNQYFQEEEMAILSMNTQDPGFFADLLCSYLNLSYDERKQAISTLDLVERIELGIRFTEDTIGRAVVSKETAEQTQIDIDKGQRKFYLRQQMQTIRQMLGEDDGQEAEIKAFEQRMDEVALEGEPREAVETQINRLKLLTPNSQEYQVIRLHIDQILEVPWKQEARSHVDIRAVRQALDKDHHGIEDVKERIVEYMAVTELTGSMAGPILCFVGPPGTGKTSLGHSIARAIGRPFIRVSVGGVRDEAEIRGHRRTYIGAMPGKIIQSLQRAGVHNPVFMIDEIDKMGANSVTGDLASAMLEVLDPEQNAAFMDHYLDLPINLSNVLFIATANTLYDIPEPLRDRMEVIPIPGYTEEEKLEIAHRYLIPKQCRQHGLGREGLALTDEAIVRVIREYTGEPGLRNFDRRMERIARKLAVALSIGESVPEHIEADDIPRYLGPPAHASMTESRSAEVGVATGLGVTSAGGQIMLIEALRIPGTGQLIITGQLGNVMQESVLAAKSYIHTQAQQLDISPDRFEKYDIHLHFPEGAVPKDGPSAGIAIAAAVASLLSDRPVRSDVAMTGEITLRGNVLAVGGIKDKVLAASRAGLTCVILPRQNENDLDSIPDPIRNRVRFVLADHIDEVLKESLSELVVPRESTLEAAVEAIQDKNDR